MSFGSCVLQGGDLSSCSGPLTTGLATLGAEAVQEAMPFVSAEYPDVAEMLSTLLSQLPAPPANDQAPAPVPAPAPPSDDLCVTNDDVLKCGMTHPVTSETIQCCDPDAECRQSVCVIPFLEELPVGSDLAEVPLNRYGISVTPVAPNGPIAYEIKDGCTGEDIEHHTIVPEDTGPLLFRTKSIMPYLAVYARATGVAAYQFQQGGATMASGTCPDAGSADCGFEEMLGFPEQCGQMIVGIYQQCAVEHAADPTPCTTVIEDVIYGVFGFMDDRGIDPTDDALGMELIDFLVAELGYNADDLGAWSARRRWRLEFDICFVSACCM